MQENNNFLIMFLKGILEKKKKKKHKMKNFIRDKLVI